MMDAGWTAATRMLVTHLLSISGVVLASQRSLAVSARAAGGFEGKVNQANLFSLISP
jgi:hypothetical protein